MNEKNLIPTLFVSSNALVIGGTILMLSHFPGSHFLMLTGIVVHLAFLILTIKEISNSKNIKNNNKILWYIALIMATTVAGLFYILTERKNTTNQNKLTQN